MTTAARVILAVDDELGIRRLLKLELSSHGYHVITAAGAEEALESVERHRPDLAIVDVILPGTSGIELMSELRERVDIPVMLLSCMDTDEAKVDGLNRGADDYVTKPFNADELCARIEAVLRRPLHAGAPAAPMIAGQCEIDVARRLVRRNGKPVLLSRIEWLMLEQLALRRGLPVPHRDLLSGVWGSEYIDDLQYLRVWIWRLRRKLERDVTRPEIIRTVHAFGYMLVG